MASDSSPGPPSSTVATVYVVDDDVSFLTAVTRLLRAGGYAVETFTSATGFLQRPPTEAHGCVIVDLQMPGLSGLELQEALTKMDDALPVIFLTGHGDIPASVQAMRQGAEDFLTKPVKKQALFEAVERGLAREARGRAQRARERAMRDRINALTPREREVLEHILSGQLNKQVAWDLGTSERTIKAHRANIMTKLGVQSVVELARLAQEAGVQSTRHR